MRPQEPNKALITLACISVDNFVNELLLHPSDVDIIADAIGQVSQDPRSEQGRATAEKYVRRH